MADDKQTKELTEATAAEVSSTDIMHIVIGPAGSNVDKKLPINVMVDIAEITAMAKRYAMLMGGGD